MILTIVLGTVILFLAIWVYISEKVASTLESQRINLAMQLRNQDQELRNVHGDSCVARDEVKRLTNKLIEVQNRANLVVKDSAERMEEFKRHPMIAAMTDGQVTILAEMLAIHLRDILQHEKEYIN
jgi:peptidoglycan hydrolase CwlO-like protein